MRAAIRPSGSAQPEWRYLIGGLVFSDLACVLLAIGVVTWLRSLPALGGHRPEDDLSFSLLVLPVVPAAAWQPTGNEDPVFRILGLLAVTIGVSYFLLSTTGPLEPRLRGNR